MCILIDLVGQVFDFLVCKAAVWVEYCIFVRRISQHAFLFAMSSFYLFQALFYALLGTATGLINILCDT